MRGPSPNERRPLTFDLALRVAAFALLIVAVILGIRWRIRVGLACSALSGLCYATSDLLNHRWQLAVLDATLFVGIPVAVIAVINRWQRRP